MKIDFRKEKCYSACELARVLKTVHGIEVSHMTVRRWMRKGRRKPWGLIKLDYIEIGGRLCSSLEALERFLDKLNEEGE